MVSGEGNKIPSWWEKKGDNLIISLYIYSMAIKLVLQVLGIRPYIKFKGHDTPKLARQIMGVYKVPIDLTIEKMYTRHLALLVSGYNVYDHN